MSIFAMTNTTKSYKSSIKYACTFACLSQDKQKQFAPAVCLICLILQWFGHLFKRGKLLSLFTQFSNSMTKSLKIRVKANNSNLSPSSVRRHRTSYKQKFIIERDAKNFAYAFILANGLLHEFAEFKHTFKQEDPHLIALSFI